MHVLNLFCNDQAGIVAAVATCLADNHCNIEESAQFNDPLSGQFFMRVVFAPEDADALRRFEQDFPIIASTFLMTYDIADLAQPIKTVIMVSKADHCLHDLLYRHRKGALPIEIAAVISNHETCRALAQSHDIPYHYLPVNQPSDKAIQEAALRDIVTTHGADLIVLARYMQVLSEDISKDYAGRIINIHHSFLPGFKGAKPYHQAYQRGVKIIGATAHFVNEDLDEGPIIEQEIMRINHSFTAEKMMAAGRDIESRVLARAIHLFAEHRIFLHDSRTVIL